MSPRVRFTNTLNLPQPIASAVSNDPYDNGGADASITTLIGPARIGALKHACADQITEDVSDRIFSLLGQLMHGLLERANTEGVAERRLYTEIEGWKISGATDSYYEHGLIDDYKLTTSYKFKDGKVPPEFEQQLNCLAVLHRRNGFKVTRLRIVGILRDWSKLEARRDPSYPQSQILILDVPMWPGEVAERFLKDRVILHQQARLSLPECSPEDRWQRPTVYAVMKAGRKTAVKLHETLEAAKAHAAADSAFYVEKRPGQQIRCENYCPCAPFCEQYQKSSKLKITAEPEQVACTG